MVLEKLIVHLKCFLVKSTEKVPPSFSETPEGGLRGGLVLVTNRQGAI